MGMLSQGEIIRMYLIMGLEEAQQYEEEFKSWIRTPEDVARLSYLSGVVVGFERSIETLDDCLEQGS